MTHSQVYGTGVPGECSTQDIIWGYNMTSGTLERIFLNRGYWNYILKMKWMLARKAKKHLISISLQAFKLYPCAKPNSVGSSSGWYRCSSPRRNSHWTKITHCLWLWLPSRADRSSSHTNRICIVCKTASRDTTHYVVPCPLSRDSCDKCLHSLS